MLSEVQGQDEGVLFLRRLIEGRFISPLLLVGEEGTGRRFSVTQAVKETFCNDDRAPGCTCNACVQVDSLVHPDFGLLWAPQDKRIEVDAIRALIDQASAGPSLGDLRFFILDGVDRMTIPAANAFLKTLEEPPPRTRFILLAESYESIIPTIRSRCGKVAYRPLPESFVLSVLQRTETDRAKALVYARMGEGSVGRAVQYWGSGRLQIRDRVFALLQLALDGDIPSLFSSIDQIGTDLPLGLRFLEHLLHDIFMVQHDPDRLINLDLCESVGRIRTAASPQVWARLGTGARMVRARHRSTRINLPFHVKSLFVDTFSGAV